MMRVAALVLVGLAGFARPSQADYDAAAYRASLARLDLERRALARELRGASGPDERAAVRRRARRLALESLDRVVFPAWMGTPWGMGPRSVATEPHQLHRRVGCSAFVVAALEDIGFRFERRTTFVRAPALYIQQSLAPAPRDLHRYSNIDPDRFAARVAALGDGLYLVGLPNHIGFIEVAAGRAEMIHAGRTGPGTVQREPVAIAPSVIASRPSGYFVTPVLADDRLVDDWLLGRPVPFRPLSRLIAPAPSER